MNTLEVMNDRLRRSILQFIHIYIIFHQQWNRCIIYYNKFHSTNIPYHLVISFLNWRYIECLGIINISSWFIIHHIECSHICSFIINPNIKYINCSIYPSSIKTVRLSTSFQEITSNQLIAYSILELNGCVLYSY